MNNRRTAITTVNNAAIISKRSTIHNTKTEKEQLPYGTYSDVFIMLLKLSVYIP